MLCLILSLFSGFGFTDTCGCLFWCKLVFDCVGYWGEFGLLFMFSLGLFVLCFADNCFVYMDLDCVRFVVCFDAYE